VNLETTFDDVRALLPDERNRAEETDDLRRLAGRPRTREESPAGPWEVVEGVGVVFSAPHEATHVRDGASKRAERDTATLAFGLAHRLGCGAIATVDGQVGDPNWDAGSPYVNRLAALAGYAMAGSAASGAAPRPSHGESLVIDIHMMRPRGVEVCLGLGPLPTQASGIWEVLIAEAVDAGLRASINWPYGANPRTITAQLQRRGLRAVQIELSSDCFNPEHPAMVRMWSALARAAQRLAGAALDTTRWSDLTRS
jgi:hypothetical protein